VARPTKVAGGRPDVICSRFSKDESEKIDAVRRSLTRGEWVRMIVLRALQEEK
jgi:hypothetical protein